MKYIEQINKYWVYSFKDQYVELRHFWFLLLNTNGAQTVSQHIFKLQTGQNYFIQMVLKNIREKAIHMKNSLHVQICCPNSKMQKYLKNNFGNIFKIFFKNCWNIFRKSANYGRKTPIFEKYFKNVPKIIFSIFWEAILYVW